MQIIAGPTPWDRHLNCVPSCGRLGNSHIGVHRCNCRCLGRAILSPTIPTRFDPAIPKEIASQIQVFSYQRGPLTLVPLHRCFAIGSSAAFEFVATITHDATWWVDESASWAFHSNLDQNFLFGLPAAIDCTSNRLHRSRFSHILFIPSDFSGPGRCGSCRALNTPLARLRPAPRYRCGGRRGRWCERIHGRRSVGRLPACPRSAGR